MLHRVTFGSSWQVRYIWRVSPQTRLRQCQVWGTQRGNSLEFEKDLHFVLYLVHEYLKEEGKKKQRKQKTKATSSKKIYDRAPKQMREERDSF